MAKEKFVYCTVLPAGFESTYYYLSFLGELEMGTRVEIPFGAENHLIAGTVLNCRTFNEDEVPFPLEKMKSITRILGEMKFKEYLAKAEKPKKKVQLKSLDSFLSKTSADLDEVDELIEDEDYDGIFCWADKHHDCVDNPEILQKVLECYELCVGQNMPQAALNLGTMYYNGRVVEQDFRKAAHYYKIAADAGIPIALCNLGYCFYYGRHQDVDYEKAYEYFLKGALLHDDINCLYKIGDMYLNGYGVEQNKTYAFILYRRAWEMCEKKKEDMESYYCLPDLQFRMGKCFLRGDGTRIDAEIALNFLTQALCGFYARRKTDPFVDGLIQSTREFIEKAQEMLEDE